MPKNKQKTPGTAHAIRLGLKNRDMTTVMSVAGFTPEEVRSPKKRREIRQSLTSLGVFGAKKEPKGQLGDRKRWHPKRFD